MGYEWYDLLGTLGVIIILWCYLSLQLGKIESEDIWFSLLNGTGAMLIIVSLLYEFNFSAFLMELFWLLISIFGIVKALKHRYKENVGRQ